jgi:hypothetical protein
MITDADIEKLKQVFATKDDLLSMEARMDRKYATKRDLDRFATKDDLNDIRTEMQAMEKRMTKKFAIKEDFHTLEQSLRSEIRLESSALHADLHEVKNEIIAAITDEIGKLYGHVGTQDERMYEMSTVQKGQSITIRDHERRIQKLEKSHHTA